MSNNQIIKTHKTIQQCLFIMLISINIAILFTFHFQVGLLAMSYFTTLLTVFVYWLLESNQTIYNDKYNTEVSE